LGQKYFENEFVAETGISRSKQPFIKGGGVWWDSQTHIVNRGWFLETMIITRQVRVLLDRTTPLLEVEGFISLNVTLRAFYIIL
jgi:hypothetical protein